ncbi:MAG: hypothetical protein O9275_10790 [Microcystis sp. LE19-196.1B]|nr:hypothetical protein [Microcystis sp. LE19-196.1B]
MWNEIKKEEDIQKLLILFNNFHDSCIRDIYISTREYVDKNLAMHFDNILTASVIFQSQYANQTVLELKFEELIDFNFRHFGKTENSVIYDAKLIYLNGLFYWADFIDWEIGDNDSTWISGKKLFWRLRPDLIGNINRLLDN